MKILKKRPLALILCIMLGGFSFFAGYSWQVQLVVSSVSLSIIVIIFIFENLKVGRKPIIIISLAAFASAVLLAMLWGFLFFPTNLYDKNCFIEAKVYDIDSSSSSTSVLILKSDSINGKKDKHAFIAYVNKEDVSDLEKYDTISFNAVISEFGGFDDGFDGKSYYLSNGYSARLSDLTDVTVTGKSIDYLDRFFTDLRIKICNTLKLRTDFETGAFLSALIVGDRSDLDGITKLNFSRLGISHILALSGMHLAILSIAVNALLIRIGLKKKIRLGIMIVLIVFYMSLTGFMPSVLRSGIMLIISSALFLISKKSDPVTSLCISVALIVLFNPTSIFDLSLWLSAFATLGVIAYSEIAEKSDKDASKLSKILLVLKNGCLVSVFAISTTFIFTASRFDAFSVASVLTTLLFSFIIELLIYGGMLLLLLGGIIPFGSIIITLSRLILIIADFVSSAKYIYLPMGSSVVKILIVLLTVFFFAFLIFEIKNMKKAITIIVLLLIGTFLAAEVDLICTVHTDDAIFSPAPSGDVVLVKSDGDVTAIYSGRAYMDHGFDVANEIISQRLTYIDNFVFTSYSYSTLDFTVALLSSIKVERLLLPIPTTTYEIDQAQAISDLLSSKSTYIEFYEMIDYLSFGEYDYRLMDKVDYAYGMHPQNAFELVHGNKRITYISTCEYKYLSPSATFLLYNSKNLIIGTIGNSNYYNFDMRLSTIESVIFYDDGRLTSEAEKYYIENGASVHCTKTPISIFD